MKLLAKENWDYLLIEHMGTTLFCVSDNESAVSFTHYVLMTKEEIEKYNDFGTSFLSKLASQIRLDAAGYGKRSTEHGLENLIQMCHAKGYFSNMIR